MNFENVKTKEVILIAVAMQNEMDVFLKNTNNFENIIINNVKFWIGKFCNKDVICMLTGVGSINCAYSFGVAISNFKIKFVINYGVAGGVGQDIHKNDFIVVEKCMNCASYRTSILEHGVDNYKWEYITFVDNDVDKLRLYNSDEKLLKLLKTKTDLLFGTCGSGDVWNREKDVVLNLRDKYNIVVSDMEAIALYQICNKLNIPIISFKVISDNYLLSEVYDRNVLSNNISNVIKLINILINY